MLLAMLRDRGGSGVHPPGYQARPIRALVDIDTQGGLRGFVENADPYAKRGLRLPVPSLKRTVGAKPILCADGPDYLFGIADDEAGDQRACARRDLHLALLQRCVAATDNPFARAALVFLTAVRDDPATADQVRTQVAAYPGDLCIRVCGRLVTDEPAIQHFWASEVGLGGSGPAEATTRCNLCGGLAEIPPMWPVSIKGIPGGQSSGTQLVSMNDDAFESYGNVRATGAMTCGPCGERIGNALNALLADKRHRILLGSVAYVSWNTSEKEFDFFDILQNPQPEVIREILRSPFTAKAEHLDAETGDLVTIALSANAARVVVREWDVVPIPLVRERLKCYFDAQMVVREWGEEPAPVSLRALAGASLRDPKDVTDPKKIPPTTITNLLRGVLAGTRLPAAMAAAVVRRIAVQDGQKVRHAQAALLTWFLTTHSQENLIVPHELDPSLDNPAYHCGRALAEIDAIQRSAMGKDINATVVDRFFGAASSRPKTVLGMLIRNAQDHLKKLRATNESAAIAHDRRLTEILERLRSHSIPTTLSLTDQTLFCLGFYHQRADDRRAMLAHMKHDDTAVVTNGSATFQETTA